MRMWRAIKFRINRIYRYEYWPVQVFYFPMFLYGLYLAARAGHWIYWSTTNLCMKYGGVMGESKMKVLRMIEPQYLPVTIIVEPQLAQDALEQKLKENGLNFPVIVKPDIGERGKKVEKVDSIKDLMTYCSAHPEHILIQEFIEHEIELGVLYYKFPGASSGHISSVTRKGFLKVRGDGQSSLEELINREIRAFNRVDYLRAKFAFELREVLPENQEFLLEPIGNHNRGTTFINAGYLVDSNLERVFDNISKKIDGFYYGRYDLKVRSLEDLYKSEGIKILELNGVSSEPAHIYDPDMNLFKAYKAVMRHMNIIYDIAAINRKMGHRPDSLKPFLRDLRLHLRRDKA